MPAIPGRRFRAVDRFEAPATGRQPHHRRHGRPPIGTPSRSPARRVFRRTVSPISGWPSHPSAAGDELDNRSSTLLQRRCPAELFAVLPASDKPSELRRRRELILALTAMARESADSDAFGELQGEHTD